MEESYLYPSSIVKPVGRGVNYEDYQLSGVLACHGYVIRDMEPEGLCIRVTAYSALVASPEDVVQFCIYPIENREALREDYLFSCRHGSNLIVRYYIGEDGARSYPMWHTAYSGLYANNGYKCISFSLLAK